MDWRKHSPRRRPSVLPVNSGLDPNHGTAFLSRNERATSFVQAVAHEVGDQREVERGVIGDAFAVE